MDYSTPRLPVPHHLLKFAQVHVHCIVDAIQPSHPLTSSSSALILSQHQNELSVPLKWPKILELQLQHPSSNAYSGLISLKIDWFDSLAVQGTLSSLLQHHRSKLSVLWHSAFFTIQLSQPYMTIGRTTALTIQTFVNRVVSLLFNTLSMFVVAFLPRSNHFLISWLQSPSAVILEPKNRKICHYFHL